MSSARVSLPLSRSPLEAFTQSPDPPVHQEAPWSAPFEEALELHRSPAPLYRMPLHGPPRAESRLSAIPLTG